MGQFSKVLLTLDDAHTEVPGSQQLMYSQVGECYMLGLESVMCYVLGLESIIGSML